MAKQFRKEKLAQEPPGVQRWRTKKVNGHLLTIAVVPKSQAGPRGGKTIATSLRHPKSEKR